LHFSPIPHHAEWGPPSRRLDIRFFCRAVGWDVPYQDPTPPTEVVSCSAAPECQKKIMGPPSQGRESTRQRNPPIAKVRPSSPASPSGASPHTSNRISSPPASPPYLHAGGTGQVLPPHREPTGQVLLKDRLSLPFANKFPTREERGCPFPP